MQLQLPFFPDQDKYINSTLGLFKKDGFVYYLHYGSPIHCHVKDDRKSYRLKSHKNCPFSDTHCIETGQFSKHYFCNILLIIILHFWHVC